ncbi:replication restart helicase PriA [Roseiflexus castenholzii]|jgi:primosomal protein N' (replication factor Y)|uniref:Replication restart protein PriA n=1 Tax=Roseiflexus castenholzii (strain DSM 13941 / HLO8) TaxID=383372 RepID=A7NMK3_ROSCS|nr:primosomal protein N' [Roseiflexus castenholzii]ABU58774.1 primosomal protein N' [Roseiflexus castenholzii DSM 13941]
MTAELLADVAVGADAVFTYRVLPPLHSVIQVGHLVWAPLRQRHVQGIVLELYTWGGSLYNPDDPLSPPRLRSDSLNRSNAHPPTLRDLIDIADPDVSLTPAQIRLARWISEYYRVSLYEALSLMLPPGVTRESETSWRATVEGHSATLGALPPGERDVLYLLRRSGEMTERDLRRRLRGSDAELQAIYAALRERGLIERGMILSRARARPRIERLVRLAVSPDEARAALETLARAPRQRALAAYLIDHPEPAPASEALAAAAADTGALRALERRGLVEVIAHEVWRNPLMHISALPDTPPALSPAQQKAWDEIARVIDCLKGSSPNDDTDAVQRRFLLYGVTGSGKTELYLRAIARVLRLGRQALVLTPEIALTTQLVRRFAARFPGRLAVLHSELATGERYDQWRRLRRGDASIAIGSRSAVFAPLPDLGLIIVDEEHEPSYKHDAAPRYHARDVAQRLAAITGSVLILGSATPSVESYAASRTGHLRLLELPDRVAMATGPDGLPYTRRLPLPQVIVVDMRRELAENNRSIFSRALQKALAETLERDEQAILFLNRRGSASFYMCRDCGHVITCPNCSSPLTLHQEASGQPSSDRSASPGLLVCHTCNHRELPPAICPHCWSSRVKSFGIGTQRVVDEIATLFPDARVLRWDRDSVGRKGDHDRLLDQFLHHEADVLVGTQMIAKGLDLPMVGLVGVVVADTGLYLPDFRAGERTFQLLTQVAGRAGRRAEGAKSIIQTYTPEHYAIRAAQEHHYHAFYEEEIAFRRQTGYPPFTRLVRFVYSAGSDVRARRAAESLADEIRVQATKRLTTDWSLIGPAPAFFHVQRNRYRWHLILRAVDPTPLLNALLLPPGWVIDIDPVHVL